MKKNVFVPADILLPRDSVDLEKWSVIACDQFSSEPDYWRGVREQVGGDPSTLDMIVPEAFLGELDIDSEARQIGFVTGNYIAQGLFHKVEDSFIYVERTLSDGRVRRGLIGAIDLDEYDFSGKHSAILASERTVLDRLPPRVSIRRYAHLETPHIMAFIDDNDLKAIEPLSEKSDTLPLLYDFDLMGGGGHIKGMQISGSDADDVMAAMRLLHGGNEALMVIGDGNHSLAAAKVYWDDLKQGLSATERKTHPAGKALLEINNVYDPAISFEAIHRVVFDVDPLDFVSAFTKAMPQGNGYFLHWVSHGKSGDIGVSAKCIGDMLTAMQTFMDEYVDDKRQRVDYIHGTDVVKHLAEQDRCVGLILPAMDKSELFATVIGAGVFPKKSFSVGNARDKRYYLECREITLR